MIELPVRYDEDANDLFDATGELLPFRGGNGEHIATCINSFARLSDEVEALKQERDYYLELLKSQTIKFEDDDIGRFRIFYSRGKMCWLAIDERDEEYVTDGDGLMIWKTPLEALRALKGEQNGEG